ncbi:MAG: hypothetical protein K0R09_2879 [Clostridiales bacterium]|jgi:hypothetical protein|nr:hypothetical protein [Clostridiales bacterium]
MLSNKSKYSDEMREGSTSYITESEEISGKWDCYMTRNIRH